MTESITTLVPIDTITPHPRNYRSHPDPQLSQLGASHARFGQFRSLVAPDRGRRHIPALSRSRYVGGDETQRRNERPPGRAATNAL